MESPKQTRAREYNLREEFAELLKTPTDIENSHSQAADFQVTLFYFV